MSQATVKTLARDPKKARYALINIARGQLGLDEDTYRGLLNSVTGKSSLRIMSLRELDQVIDRMKANGFQASSRPKAPHKRAGARSLADDPQARKIRALWISGYHLGVIRDPSEAALIAFAKRLTGADALQWTVSEGANDVIEALKDMLHREARVEWSIYEREQVVSRRSLELVYEDRYWIVRAQCQLLRAAGREVEGLDPDTYRPGDVLAWEDGKWQQLMETLGREIRTMRAGAR